MKKLTALFFMLILLAVSILSGCGSSGYYGTYGFQMGKSDSTHISVSLKLTKDRYVNKSGEDLGERFEISLDAPKIFDSQVLTDVLTDSGVVSGDVITLKGFYKIGEKEIEGNKDGYHRLELNIALLEGILDEPFEIPQEFIKNFIHSEINTKTALFVIPVSLDDLLLQVYWYGYDIHLENIGSEDPTKKILIELPAEQHHDIGTHPTAEDVKEINKTYPQTHKDEDGEEKLFRDFHCLNFKLAKES